PAADPAGVSFYLDLEPAVRGEGRLVLADLVVLGHVGVEVVLPREAALRVDPEVEGEGGPDAELDGATVDDGQDAGHALADRAGLAVRGRAEGGGAAAEHLRARQEVDVDLEPDDRLVARRHGRPSSVRPRDGEEAVTPAPLPEAPAPVAGRASPSPPRRRPRPGRAWPRRTASR